MKLLRGITRFESVCLIAKLALSDKYPDFSILCLINIFSIAFEKKIKPLNWRSQRWNMCKTAAQLIAYSKSYRHFSNGQTFSVSADYHTSSTPELCGAINFSGFICSPADSNQLNSWWFYATFICLSSLIFIL